MNDDAPAIQAALLKGGKVLLDPGRVYNIASHIVVQGGPIWLEGNGAILKCADTFEVADAAGDVFGFVQCDGIYVGDLTINQNRSKRGNALTVNPVALRLLGCQHFLIENCNLLDSPADHIRLAAQDPSNPATACMHGRIKGCYLDGCYRNLISCIGAAWVRIDHNRFFNALAGQAPNSAIDVEPNFGDAQGICHDIDIDHNTAGNCAIAFSVYNPTVGTKNIRIRKNIIGSGCVDGVVSEGFQTLISRNELTDCGIAVDNSDAATVTWNTIVNGSIYADTTGVVTPRGHLVANNTVDGKITTDAKTISIGNVSRP